jgi:hypothetical protein
MLQARRTSMWRNRYQISLDGRPVTTWDGAMWRTGGSFELEGQRFEVRSNVWGSRFGMATDDGRPYATADRVGRKRWTVTADGRSYEFRRPSMWRSDQELLLDGEPAGHIRKISLWRNDAEADLPGLPLAVQLFVLVVVLTTWETQGAAAASSAG